MKLASLMAELADVSAKVNGLLIGTTNGWAMSNVSAIAAQTSQAGGGASPTNAVPLAGIVLPVLASGIFEVHMSLSFSGNTATKQCALSCVSDTIVGGTLQAGAGGATIATAGVGATGASAAASGKVLTSSATGLAVDGLLYGAPAAGIPFTNAQIVQKVAAQETLAAQLTTNGAGQMTFEAHGYFYNAIGTAKTRFTVGNTVAFGLLFEDITGGGNVWTFSSLDFTVKELSAF